MRINKGDRVEIRIPEGTYRGTVTEASNQGTDEEPNWYVLFTHDKPVPGHVGQGYYKQGQDGGTIEVL